MERGHVLRSYFVGGIMTDKRKIEILERLVSNQQQEINELRQEKAELQAKIDEYSALDDDVQELRNELFKENSELTNLEFIEKSLKLREALLKEDPSNDIFVARGHNISPTQADYDTAERVAEIYAECVDYANGDSELFTQELMRRTNDAMPQHARRR